MRKGNPAKFTVDTTGAGQAPLDVNVTDKTGGSQCLNRNYSYSLVCTYLIAYNSDI